MPQLPAVANGIPRNAANIRAGAQPTGVAEDIRVALAHAPTDGNSVEDWIEYLIGRIAVLETSNTQLRGKVDALEQTAVRAASDDWNDVTDHLAEYGDAGLLISTSSWTSLDAQAMIWQSSPTATASGSYAVIAQIPEEFDIDLFRVQYDITGNGVYNFSRPNASDGWREFSGTLSNGEPGTKYYIMADRATGNTQYMAVLPVGGSMNLQHNDGTPASQWIPDDTVTPGMLDADDMTKMEAFRTRIGAGTGSGGGAALTDDSVLPQHLDADDATKQLAFRNRLGITAGGLTIDDDSILPAKLRADSAEHMREFRQRIGARIDVGTFTIMHAQSTMADGSSPTGTASQLLNPIGEYFSLRLDRIDRSAYRVLIMDSTSRILTSAIGESGETIEQWVRQSDNVTWVLGPVANNARDPETFTLQVK